MERYRSRFLFDPQDFALLQTINDFLERRGRDDRPKMLLDPYLHPRGIKELAEGRSQRIAYAMAYLLDALEGGRAEDRVTALRSLHDEVLHNTSVSLQRNTARVMLAIMKQVVRERHDPLRQLHLAHDFFAAASGRPSVVRRELKKYHLLEMPEEWNQVAFDHHVHDANTKGRKSPTHLIMDAWIKGIRDLTVVYYNFVRPETANELTEAADIMGITVRIGIEVMAQYRGRFVPFIWAPRGFLGRQDFLAFLNGKTAEAFFSEGREVSDFHGRFVLDLLDNFNRKHLPDLNRSHNIDLPPLSRAEFLEFVGVGQPAVAHLADFIHQKALPKLSHRLDEIRVELASVDAGSRPKLQTEAEAINGLLPDGIAARYLRSTANPEIPDPKAVTQSADLPRLLTLNVRELIEYLNSLRAGSRITLNSSNLSPADVVEILYQAGGAITHMEVFNLKDYARHQTQNIERIAEVRRTVNAGDLISCKRLIRNIQQQVAASDLPDKTERIEALRAILADAHRFLGNYAHKRLQSRLGSDSVGRSRTQYGMGMVIRETLPWRVRRQLGQKGCTGELLPVRTEVLPHTDWHPRESPARWINAVFNAIRSVPGLTWLGYRSETSYQPQGNTTRLDTVGNIATLGGMEDKPDNGLGIEPAEAAVKPAGIRWRYLNTRWKNIAKVVIGFLPAFLTFLLTKDWWVLAYFGAVIWFGITGLRNILQAVIGGGGLMRSSRLHWNDLVSWSRVADSLLFTGFSVPLLDWLVKTLLLDETLGINTRTAPLAMYAVIAVVNGTYLASHNTLRGLPTGAVFGNLFRSVLSIPLAFAINAVATRVLVSQGMAQNDADLMLQKWAAVIAKAASDLVASLIEGLADRGQNMRLRAKDYRAKIQQVLDIHGRLEVLFPDANVVELLASPKELIRAVEHEARRLEAHLIINALDLLYFWYYQPRARLMFARVLKATPEEERQIIIRAQGVLKSQRKITQMFLDHLVGKRFSQPLAFYLDRAPSYLAALEQLDRRA